MFSLFQYDFIIRAFVAGTITAIVAPAIGMFLVVRRYSLMADTLAHVSLVGVAIGILTNTNPVMGSLIVAVVASVAIEGLRESKKIFGESILALFLSGGLALAVVIVSLGHGFSVNLMSYLFGSITTVSGTDIGIIAAAGTIILLALAMFYKEFFCVAFNEELSAASGMNVRALNIALIILAAITVSLSMRIVGALLIGALMIIPTVSAIQFKMSFKKTLALSMGFSLFAVISGLFASYYFNLASGGTIVVIALLVFCLSLLANQGAKG
jgi:zinc transport system permease protein